MRVLVVAPEFEDTNYRGIQFVTKLVIKAFSTLGHQVILLTSHPSVKIQVSSKRLREKVLNTYLRQYLFSGAKLNQQMSLRRKGVMGSELQESENSFSTAVKTVMSFVGSLWSRLLSYTVDKTQMSGIPMVQYVDEVVNIPYFYRLANAMPKLFRRVALEKAARSVKADLVFVSFPLKIPRLRSAKIMQIVYDLIPFEIAEEPVELNWLPNIASKIDYVIANTDLLCTISEDSKNKIIEIAPYAKPQVLGGAISAFPEELDEYKNDSPIINKFGLKDKKYLVFISSVEKRKNVHRLLRAFVSVADKTDATLVVVGNRSASYNEIVKELDDVSEEIRNRIIFTGYASEADKYTLLRHARSLINPTLYEGFGLPVLEAYVVGCPVVASAVGALVEVGGDAMLKISNPYSVAEIGAAIVEIAKNDALCEDLVKKGYKQAARYTEDIFKTRVENALKFLGEK